MTNPTSNQHVSYSATGDRFWYDANGVTRPATHRDIAGELERLHAAVKDLQCEHESLLRGRKPTHRCKVCSALWIDFGDSWSLFSRRCGQCCDNVAMGDQIEALPVIRPVETTVMLPDGPAPFRPTDEVIRRVCLGGMRTTEEGREIITYLRWLERRQAVEAARRTDTRLAGDIEYCLAKINPATDVHAILTEVMKDLRSPEEPTPEPCVLTDGVIHCRCGHPSSHYGTMGARGAREVREVSVANPTVPLTCDGACRYPDVGQFVRDPSCSMHGVKAAAVRAPEVCGCPYGQCHCDDGSVENGTRDV